MTAGPAYASPPPPSPSLRPLPATAAAAATFSPPSLRARARSAAAIRSPSRSRCGAAVYSTAPHNENHAPRCTPCSAVVLCAGHPGRIAMHSSSVGATSPSPSTPKPTATVQPSECTKNERAPPGAMVVLQSPLAALAAPLAPAPFNRNRTVRPPRSSRAVPASGHSAGVKVVLGLTGVCGSCAQPPSAVACVSSHAPSMLYTATSIGDRSSGPAPTQSASTRTGSAPRASTVNTKPLPPPV